MLESLGRINNPLVRSIAAAATVGSVITLSAAVVIGVTNAKAKSAYQFGVYSSLFGTASGAIFGLVYTNKASGNKSTPDLKSSDSHVWQDWRNFVIVRKVKESEEITSFYLQPEDKGEIPNFQPGQFLTIKLDIPGQDKPVIRTYSLSDYPEKCEYYRLSIKREPAPNGLDVMPGIASNFMHDRVQKGSVILAKPPNGKFVLDVRKSIPIVLISNGVGITLMISMAKASSLLNPTRPIWFVHGARDGKFHAFRDEVREIARQNHNLNMHFCYSRPTPEDRGKYHSVGYIDAALIQELVRQEAEYFLCGSPSFMQSIMQGLKESGVPDSRVFFESFGRPMKSQSDKQTAGATGDKRFAEIVFAKSGKTLTWQPSDGTILEFAEANDINPPFSCRVGVCGTCMCKIREGIVAYQEQPTATTDKGSVLICISQPGTAKLVLDI
ncbi:MAG: 2Fe-2S iron-sulfur cluster binding domain-containing protein [Nostoc sp. NMS1]|uniref:2Fe-2S iron-sulfur cluster-binding protein n=1 Tax=unclassified Nostoc TaxID=2593658 RepID=UPI0025D8A0D0|nr:MULTISPECIES: 2Fe-2S iron-sulfur cluster-binding protein [unclassified Nostoc]MBN3905601.1 2Fe-2S iron-sulfur cluster binding domain-containing protein [Nostoc sp. NMS1]MBN3989906.1 2Fe-2S iron-sulfur cluster binding domain-containing protein [Nostoc sp. NMS2]